jgi:hypothetical protein
MRAAQNGQKCGQRKTTACAFLYSFALGATKQESHRSDPARPVNLVEDDRIEE